MGSRRWPRPSDWGDQTLPGTKPRAPLTALAAAAAPTEARGADGEQVAFNTKTRKHHCPECEDAASRRRTASACVLRESLSALQPVMPPVARSATKKLVPRLHFTCRKRVRRSNTCRRRRVRGYLSCRSFATPTLPRDTARRWAGQGTCRRPWLATRRQFGKSRLGRGTRTIVRRTSSNPGPATLPPLVAASALWERSQPSALGIADSGTRRKAIDQANGRCARVRQCGRALPASRLPARHQRHQRSRRRRGVHVHVHVHLGRSGRSK
jgi:hypothetical protein